MRIYTRTTAGGESKFRSQKCRINKLRELVNQNGGGKFPLNNKILERIAKSKPREHQKLSRKEKAKGSVTIAGTRIHDKSIPKKKKSSQGSREKRQYAVLPSERAGLLDIVNGQ